MTAPDAIVQALMSGAFYDDPYPTYTVMRDQAPALFLEPIATASPCTPSSRGTARGRATTLYHLHGLTFVIDPKAFALVRVAAIDLDENGISVANANIEIRDSP